MKKLRKLLKQLSKPPLPEEVPDLRTNARRLEAAFEAWKLNSKKKRKTSASPDRQAAAPGTEKIADSRFDNALALTNAMRKNYLEMAPSKRRPRRQQQQGIGKPVLLSTSNIAA